MDVDVEIITSPTGDSPNPNVAATGAGAETTITTEETETTETYPPLSSAFILFRSQLSAHLASQILLHNEPYRMTMSGYSIEVAPGDVIWGNLGLNPYEVRVREAVGWLVTVGLVVVWAIPGEWGFFLSLSLLL